MSKPSSGRTRKSGAGTVRVFVHLGPMKTGTSAFAAHLSRHATAGTLPPHILYPTGDLWYPARGGIVKHHDLVEVTRNQPLHPGEHRRQTEATPENLRERFAAIAAAARDRGGDVLVVMVCEIADQRATPDLGSVLREYFDSVDFVIVARDQIGAIRSLLGQQIRMWNRTDVTSLDSLDFTTRHAARGSYDYERLWDKWVTPSKDYTIHFVPYRSGSGADDLSQDIFDVIGAGPFPHHPDLLRGERIHSTFSAARMRDLATIKHWTKRLRAIPGARAVGKRLFDLTLRRAHQEIARNDSAESWRFSDAERSAILDAYRASNTAFRAKLGRASLEPRWVEWFDKTLGETP